MPPSKYEVSRRVWQCVNACKHKDDSDDEKLFMNALTNSDTLSKQLARAKLSRQEVEGFISTTLTLNLDYLFLQSRLNGAKRHQSMVKKKAADLAQALMKLSTHSLIQSELLYKDSFLQSIGIKATLKGGLDALTPLSTVVRSIEELAEKAVLDESGFVKAALYSRKKNEKYKPHQYAAALLDCTPEHLKEKICPAIATVVALRHKVNFSSTEVRRILRDSDNKNRIECQGKNKD